jgi:hypothetical protein
VADLWNVQSQWMGFPLRSHDALGVHPLAAGTAGGPGCHAELAVSGNAHGLMQRWNTCYRKDVRGKRQLLKIVCLNFSLDGVTLVPTMRKPFDLLTEGLSVPLSRGDRRWTFLNEPSGQILLMMAVSQSFEFSADTFYAPGSV